jgi:hypothetical protein
VKILNLSVCMYCVLEGFVTFISCMYCFIFYIYFISYADSVIELAPVAVELVS